LAQALSFVPRTTQQATVALRRRMAATPLRLAILCLAAFSAAAADHPIENVMNLLGGLKKQAEEEGFQEEQAYGKYEYWCQTSLSTLEAAITRENEKIDSLEIKIDGLEKEEKVLEEEIDQLKKTVIAITTASSEATTLRGKQSSAYDTASENLGLTIKAIDDSLAAMEASQSKTEGSSLAQEQVRKIIALLHTTGKHLEVKPNLTAYGDREAHVDKYDFKSENVIEILKQLKSKFEDDLTQATAEETNSLNAFTVAETARAGEKAAASKSQSQKEITLGEVQQDLSTARQALIDEKSDLAADTKSRDETKSACGTKAAEWEERSKTRTNEIKAIVAAVEILSKVSGVRYEASNNPKLGKSPLEASLLQVAAESKPTKARAVELIRAAARKSKSHALERLAVEVSNHLTGPFDEVNNMIQKMIFHLEKEQKDEDTHKDWCDLEIEKTTKHQGDRTDSLGLLNAKINELDATINTLTNEIATANGMISKLTEFMKEATEIREAGKKENAISLKDAVDAQTALANAISVLEAHYKESGAIPESLMQAPVELPENPDTWTSSYTGVADPKKQPDGIITILESVSSEFSEMEAQTKAQEETDQKDYQETMKQSKVALAERKQEVKEKEDQKMESISELDSTKDKKKRTADELDQWNTYMTNLQPACVEGDSTYAERKQARTDEIEALKTAQTTLAEAFKESFIQKSRAAFLQVRRHVPQK